MYHRFGMALSRIYPNLPWDVKETKSGKYPFVSLLLTVGLSGLINFNLNFQMTFSTPISSCTLDPVHSPPVFKEENEETQGKEIDGTSKGKSVRLSQTSTNS